MYCKFAEISYAKNDRLWIEVMVKKIILWLIILIIIILVMVYLSLNYWVKHSIETIGSAVLGVPVIMQSVNLKPWNGEITIADLQIGNPKPFEGKYLTKVGSIHVNVDIDTLFDNEILIDYLKVDNAHVVYQTGFGGSNLGQLQVNIAKKQQVKDKDPMQSVQSQPQRTVVIRELKINNTQVTGSALGAGVNLVVPNIYMKNVGKTEGGMSFTQLSRLIMQALISNVGQLGLSIVTGAIDLVGNTAVYTVGAVSKGVGKVAGGAADTVGGAAQGVGNAIGSLFGGDSSDSTEK